MYAVTVTFTLNEGRQEDFLPLMIANARASQQEPACRQFDVCTDPDQPDTVFLYELYDDLAGFHAHMETPHFKSLGPKVSDMVADKHLVCFAMVDR
ncbi:antibiotic biosynthesis monooxygenase [Rhodobacterales bacterium 56_14_T64]|nr:antibiotic biosynthesis monooxygenase [Rhodobacterales bacterium 56_14_T64]